jgi:hypothetical protein
MSITQEHLDFEKFCRQLIGLTIIKVEYSEIDYNQANHKPNYSTKFTNLDSVDFSIFFHTTDEKVVEIFWDDTFFQFGIGIKVNEPSDFSSYIKWDVSSNNLWKKFIGTCISEIYITWETVKTTEKKSGKTENFVYPKDIKITFNIEKSIFISAASFLDQSDNVVHGMSDTLTVTDNEELARKVKMIN